MFNMSLIIFYYVMLFILCLIPLFVYLIFSIIEKRRDHKRGKKLRFYYSSLDWCKHKRMEIALIDWRLTKRLKTPSFIPAPPSSIDWCIRLRMKVLTGAPLSLDWLIKIWRLSPSFYSLYFYIFIYYIL